MQEGFKRCMRCNGRKKMYKVRSIYTHANTGGLQVDCPMCLGEGKIKTIEKALMDSKKKKAGAKHGQEAERA
jgi:hypothetical protein